MSDEAKDEAKTAAGVILLEEINKSLDKSKSPVKNGAFKKMKKEGGRSTLFEEGDMRGSLDFGPLTNGVEVGIFDDVEEVERLKAFNHNTGDTLPKREFIPATNKRFNDDIMAKVNKAVDEIRKEDAASTEIAPSISTLFSDDDLDALIAEVLRGES